MLEVAAILLAITVLLAYLNERFIGLPTAIGVMAAALVLSLTLVGLSALGIAGEALQYERSLHVDLSRLKSFRWPVIMLAL